MALDPCVLCGEPSVFSAEILRIDDVSGSPVLVTLCAPHADEWELEAQPGRHARAEDVLILGQVAAVVDQRLKARTN